MADIDNRKADTLIGWAAYGAVAVGIAGLIGAAASVGDGVSVGACLIASAIAFGLLANALLRQ